MVEIIHNGYLNGIGANVFREHTTILGLANIVDQVLIRMLPKQDVCANNIELSGSLK